MSSFDGRLRMPGLARLPVSVVVDIVDERLTLTTGERRLGTWQLSKIEVLPGSDGFHLRLDDEEIVLGIVDSAKFEAELGRAMKRVPSTPASAVDDTTSSGNESADSSGNAVFRRLAEIGPDEQFRDVEQRIAKLEEDVMSESVSPEEVFRRWLRLMKEINLKHGQAAMPATVYYRLNCRLLDVMPEPTSPHREVPAT